MMKIRLSILSTGLLALLVFPGCGNDRAAEEEVIRDLEENFAIERGSDAGSAQQGTTSTDRTTTTSAPRTSAGDSSAPREAPRTTETASTADGEDSASRDVDPETQEAARNVVRLMQSGQYESAVDSTYRLMNSPNLTSGQRRAARNTMAEIQKRIITDPNISEEEKRRAREVLTRDRP